jgi:hypothetical protein
LHQFQLQTGSLSHSATPGVFIALPPRLVPSACMLRAVLKPDLMREVAACAVTIATGSPAEAVAALAALRGRPPTDGVRAGLADMAAEDKAGRPPANVAGHDRFFHIHRIPGPKSVVFLHSILAAATLFHAEMAAEPERSGYFGAVGAGFAALLGHLAGVATAPIDLAAAPAPVGTSSCKPAFRWVIGHQIFAALTQGLVMALQEFEAAMVAGVDVSVSSALALAADLLLASAASFRFACDFPPAAYEDDIRPSMMPPHVGEGFSGLLSDDHRALVQVMTRLRPLMEEAAARFPAGHKRLTAAFQRVYADHKFICARFGGAEAPSLRGRTCSHLSGVQQLESYERARSRLLHPIDRDDGSSADSIGPIE